MELLLLALGVLGLAAVGGAMAGLFDAKERIRRVMRHARTLAIREVKDGQIGKVAGRVRAAGEPLLSPFTGRRCVYWEIEVTAWEGTQGHEVRRAHEQRDFVLEDGTGKALVKVDRAAIAAKVDARWAQHDRDNRLAHQALQALGVETLPGVLLTYSEAVIEVGEDVQASGRGAWDPDPGAAAGYRQMPLRLVLMARPGEVVVVMGSEKEARWQG